MHILSYGIHATPARVARASLKTEGRKVRIIGRSRKTGAPAKLPLGFGDRYIVNRSVPCPHQAAFVEFPILVAERAVPVAGDVVRLVGEADGDAVVRKRPELLNEPIVEFALPLARQECDDLGTAAYASATRAGSREFQASSAARTLTIAVSRVNGGTGARTSPAKPLNVHQRRENIRCGDRRRRPPLAEMRRRSSFLRT